MKKIVLCLLAALSVFSLSAGGRFYSHGVEEGDNVAVSELSTWSTRYLSGSTLNYSYTFQYKGGTPVDNQNTYIYLSPDGLINTSSILIDSLGPGSFGGEFFLFKSGSVRLPDTLDGEYFLVVAVDPHNTIAEINESDNKASVKISVSMPYNDLVSVLNPGSQTNVVAGAEFKLSYMIKSTGNVVPNRKTTTGVVLSNDLHYDSSDVILHDNAHTEFSGGNIFSVNTAFQIPIGKENGKYWLLVVADLNNELEEKNEVNNIAGIAINITDPFIDLVVSGKDTTKLSGRPGEYANPLVSITNQGSVVSPAGKISIFFSEDTIPDNNDLKLPEEGFFEEINPGAFRYGSKTWVIIPVKPAGKYYLIYKLDGRSEIGESNENNNLGWVEVEVKPSEVDVKIGSVKLINGPLVGKGVAYDIYVPVYNTGDYDARNIKIGFYISKDSLFDIGDRHLATGEIYNVPYSHWETLRSSIRIPQELERGEYFIFVKIDDSQLYFEANESDNSGKIRVIVDSAFVDLEFSRISAPEVIKPKANVFIAGLVDNNGNRDLYDFASWLYLSKDTVLDEKDLVLDSVFDRRWLYNNSAASVSFDFDLPASVTYGNYYFLLKVDPKNEIAESNESNNIYVLRFAVSEGQQNLSFEVAPPKTVNAAQGQFVRTQYSIKAYGFPSSQPLEVSYYLSSTDTTDLSSFKLLGKYSTTIFNGIKTISDSVLIPEDVEHGVYLLRYYIDYNGRIPEYVISDNYSQATLSIGSVTSVDAGIPQIGVEIYPNPASEFISVKKEGNSSEAVEVTIMGELGNEIETTNLLPGDKMDISHLIPGCYISRIKSGDGYVKKMILIAR